MKQILFAIGIICIMQSCIKDTTPTPPIDGLPAATQVGANTFGCLVDGTIAQTTIAYNQLFGKGVEYSFNTDSVLYIKAITLNNRKDFYFQIKCNNNILGIHDANKSVSSGYPDLNIDGGTAQIGGNYYTTIDSLPATITITKFTGTPGNMKKGDIISGTFDFVMVNGAGIKVHLTSGRFDLRK